LTVVPLDIDDGYGLALLDNLEQTHRDADDTSRECGPDLEDTTLDNAQDGDLLGAVEE
jgi:hypothetical protein